MFTGIIQALGSLQKIEPQAGDCRLYIATGELPMQDVQPGDSIAVNGVCLTAIEPGKHGFAADVSAETLSKTTLGQKKAGDKLNLEKALTLSTPLGGHLVSGHVDGVGQVIRRWHDGRSERFDIRAPKALARYIARKGSICVDGISLTVNEVNGDCFALNIVPHTLQVTTIGDYQAGTAVNLEVDLIARYLERLMLGDKAADPQVGGVSQEFLQQHGFIE